MLMVMMMMMMMMIMMMMMSKKITISSWEFILYFVYKNLVGFPQWKLPKRCHSTP